MARIRKDVTAIQCPRCDWSAQNWPVGSYILDPRINMTASLVVDLEAHLSACHKVTAPEARRIAREATSSQHQEP
jgi:hypothetical protein